MDAKYIAIIGGLIGSGFTIIVTKLFDFIQTKQTHKLSLKREFFLRKINVFEKTVSYITIAHTSITNMAVLLKTALMEDVYFSEEQNKDIFNKLEKNIQDVYKTTQETAGAIDLYIDLKHDDDEVNATQKFLELLGTINQLAHDINYGYDLFSQVKNSEEHKKLELAIELNTKKLSENVENLLMLSNSIRKKYLGTTSLLREQLKEYE